MWSWSSCLLAAVTIMRLTYIMAKCNDSNVVDTFGTETDKQILDCILDKRRYDNRTRPHSQTVINVTVLILSLSSPDESSLKYEVEFLLNQRWTDPRLKYDDKDRYRYLNAISHFDGIWIPDIYFIKHGEFKQPLAPVHMSLKVFKDGTVRYITRRSMILNCQGNLQIFPFDNPKCPFAIESVSHESSELELSWENGSLPIDGATSLRYHNAYLVKNETGYCDQHHTWRGNYSCLKVLLVFTRDKSFYFSTVFGPGMVLVTSSFISFWLDINAVPARVMIGVTTMLNFCTTTNSFRSTLPVVSNLTAMNLWDGVCMFFIYASMLEFIVVNYLYRKFPHGTPKSASQQHHHQVAGRSESHLRPNQSTGFSQVGRWCGTYDASIQKYPQDGGNESLGGARGAARETLQNTHELQAPPGREMGGAASERGGPAPVISLFRWLSKPRLVPEDSMSRQRISKLIDNVSKIFFPVMFGSFILGYFLTYAVIKPTHPENWELLSRDHN